MDLKKMKEGLKGGRKGQAVMEYLITYGLALFVILIVLAILVAVVLPQLKAPESCQFTQPGFGCSTKQHVIISNSNNNNDVTAIIQLDNQQGRGIILYGMLCSSDTAGNLNTNAIIANQYVYVATQAESSMNAGSSHAFTLDCANPDGTLVSLTPGSTFKGSIAVLYNFQDEVSGAPPRLAVATITGTTQTG